MAPVPIFGTCLGLAFQGSAGGNDKAFMVYRSLAIEAYEGG
jgi:hypothetical protein